MSKKPKGKGTWAKARVTKKQQIANAIAACRDARGIIRPKDVVAAARDPDNILHGEFEWNEDKLVQQALELRAAELIRQCRSIIQYEERELIFPTYVSHPREVDRAYAETVSIARNAGLKKLALEAELARIKAAIKRATALAMVFGLHQKFEMMLQDIIDIEVEVAQAAE